MFHMKHFSAWLCNALSCILKEKANYSLEQWFSKEKEKGEWT